MQTVWLSTARTAHNQITERKHRIAHFRLSSARVSGCTTLEPRGSAIYDPAWNRFLVHEGIAKRDTVIYAETSIVDGMSFLKGTSLILTGNMAATPEHIVVHELAHITLRSKNEDAVDAQCNRWITQQQSRPGSLVVAVSSNPVIAEARPN